MSLVLSQSNHLAASLSSLVWCGMRKEEQTSKQDRTYTAINGLPDQSGLFANPEKGT